MQQIENRMPNEARSYYSYFYKYSDFRAIVVAILCKNTRLQHYWYGSFCAVISKQMDGLDDNYKY